MNKKILLRALLLTPVMLVGAILLVPQTVAQDEPAADPRVTKYHQVLLHEIGEWDVELTMNGAVSKGEEVCRMVGDFWMLTEFNVQLPGFRFEGAGLTGFDTSSGHYVNEWVDNTSPVKSTMKGTLSDDTKTRTYRWTAPNPATGESMEMRGVHVLIDEDHRTYAQYFGESEEPAMSAKYTRRKKKQ